MQHKSMQILPLLHMTVDALCACCLFALVPLLPPSTIFNVFVLYNCLAFLTQPITGLWIDRIGTRNYAFLLSVALLVIGASLQIVSLGLNIPISPYLIATSIGLGNSLFHVFGGKYVTNISNNDMRHLGIFVSTGALGLFIGERIASVIGLSSIIILLALLSFLFIKVTDKRTFNNNYYSHRSSYEDSTQKYGIPFLLFILLIVAFRSFLGKMMPSSTHYLACFPLYACLLAVSGKALGGYVARVLGTNCSLLLTLLLSGCTFLLGYYHVGFILAMILFINLSMPITLHIANRCCPHYEAFAFGLLAAFLIPGYALGMISVDSPLANHLLYPLIATILIEALVLLLLREKRRSVLSASVVINILTNVPLNLYVWYADKMFTIQDIVLLESGVVLIEFLLYWLVTRNHRKAILYALMCNVISYLSGLLFLMYK